MYLLIMFEELIVCVLSIYSTVFASFPNKKMNEADVIKCVENVGQIFQWDKTQRPQCSLL